LPNIKSVKKDVKKSRELRLRNLSAKSAIKTFVKKTKSAIDAGEQEAAAMVGRTISTIDKAAKHGIIHRNAASRRKSRLMRRMNAKQT
jgi:small subunit ribosomal protein S20